jgi:4-hydroxybenzoate polyprenyltransferase
MAEAAAAGRAGTFVAYLKLFRLPLVFTAIADSAAGFLSIWGFRWKDPAIYALLALTSAGLYCFGMAMNDIADRERDRTLAPGRPLPSGRITLRGALFAAGSALALSALGLVLNPVTSPWSYAAWGAAVVAILLYDFVLKVPPVMGSIRAFNFLIGALSWHLLAIDPARWGGYVWPSIALFVYGTSLTFVSTLEDGAVRRGVLWLGAAGMVAGALLPSLAALPAWQALGPAGLLVLWVLFRALRATDRKGLLLMVRDGVAGFILLDASIAIRYYDPRIGLAIAALLIPAFLLIALFKRLA